MAEVRPLRAIRFDPRAVEFGAVLAPPYDVISDERQAELYEIDLRNVVRIDDGLEYPDDIAGANDRYTRARAHLESWLGLGILVRDEREAVYVTAHDFILPDGTPHTRLGLLARVRARPWETSDLRPHEHTLRGPKEDRLALMRATGTQTSPVFAVWQDAAGLDQILGQASAGDPTAAGTTAGEIASEHHRLWVVDDPAAVAAVTETLAPARLYVADGHHRYETSAAYAAERRTGCEGHGERDSEFCLVYLSDAADPGMALLPTHRLLLPREGAASSLDELRPRLGDGWELTATPTLAGATAEAEARRATHHAFGVAASDGTALLSRPRRDTSSPRAGLDVTVLQDEVLAPAGVDEPAIRGGALRYTRDRQEVDRAVESGQALLGFCLNGATPEEVIAVADAGEVMPQKSTYFYPKVPTGLVLSPL